jgi:hypothetical protein
MKNITTITLIIITVLLLFFTIYIGWLLKSQGQTAPTTIKKTKASAITYSKTVLIAKLPSLSPTQIESEPTASPKPEPTLLADKNLLTPSLTPTSQITVIPTAVSTISPIISPTISPTISITVEPTEELIAKNISVSPTQSSSPTAKLIAGKNLPESGSWGSYATIIALASMIIFLSFLY